MDLTLHGATRHAVRGIGPDGAIIGDHQYSRSLIVSADQLDDTWSITAPAQLDREHAARLLSLGPEIVIIGTGERVIFPPPQFAAAVMASRVGLESMDNAAACRTYNVLLDEGRGVVLALIMSD